jgi:hypothetical protein
VIIRTCWVALIHIIYTNLLGCMSIKYQTSVIPRFIKNWTYECGMPCEDDTDGAPKKRRSTKPVGKKLPTKRARTKTTAAAPSHTPPTAVEPGIVHISDNRLSDHIMTKYGEIRKKQNDFVVATKSMAVGVLSDEHPVLQEHVLAKCMDTSSLLLQCEDDLSCMASMVTRAPHNTMSTNVGQSTIHARASVVVVSREWEERFLHEARGCERKCCNSKSETCFASLIENNGILDPSFSLCEFYPEATYNEIEKTQWLWPTTLQPCILCLRNSIYSKFLDARCNNTNVLSSITYASIGNLVGVRGEYCVENVFVSSPDRYEGVTVPVVIPSVRDYAVVLHNGIRSLKQKLPFPEHQRSSFFFG